MLTVDRELCIGEEMSVGIGDNAPTNAEHGEVQRAQDSSGKSSAAGSRLHRRRAMPFAVEYAPSRLLLRPVALTGGDDHELTSATMERDLAHCIELPQHTL